MFLRQQPLVLGFRQIEFAPQVPRDAGDELVLAHDGLDVLEHRLALVRVDAERGDHVEQGVRVDVLLMRVPAEHQLQLRRRDEFAHHMLDVVAHNALRGGEVADAHADDPALLLAHQHRVPPLLDVLAHRDVLRLPMVRLHFPIQFVGPLVLQRQQVERHRFPAVDHLLAGKSGLGLLLVQHEGFRTDLENFLHG
jgi:hypothetical protein